MKTFKEIYQQIVRQQTNKDDDNLTIVQRRQQQKDKILNAISLIPTLKNTFIQCIKLFV